MSQRRLRSAARLVLRAEGIRLACLELALLDDTAMRAVHQRFLGIDSPTDVLTFPHHEPGETLSGEIVISVETARREGPTHGLSPENEVFLYLAHGILHLCGYDDHTPSDSRRMRRRQAELLDEICGIR